MLGRYGLYFAWLFSCLGSLGSLYFSEVRHLEPCHLCWYQRITMFPLCLILGVGAYLCDYKAIRYSLPLAILGLLFAIYQILIQAIPGWNPIELCGAGPSCLETLDVGLGPITIPMLSAVNFFLIVASLLATWFHVTQEALHAHETV